MEEYMSDRNKLIEIMEKYGLYDFIKENEENIECDDFEIAVQSFFNQAVNYLSLMRRGLATTKDDIHRWRAVLVRQTMSLQKNMPDMFLRHLCQTFTTVALTLRTLYLILIKL